jgi:hypothetical protein
MPSHMKEIMKKIASFKGFSGYPGLLRGYVGAKLREDLKNNQIRAALIEGEVSGEPKPFVASAFKQKMLATQN